MNQLTFARVVRSEWTKMASLRSTWFVLVGVPLACAVLSGLIGWTNRTRATDPTVAIGGGFLLYAVAIGVFGLLLMTGEHQSGLIRATLATVPKRLPVLAAKAVLLVVVTGPIMVAAYFGSFGAFQAFVEPAVRITLDEPGIVRAIFGAAGATVACGLIGLATGAILRSTPIAITAYVLGLVVLPPVVLSALPAPTQDSVLGLFPTLALQGMFLVGEGTTAILSPGFATLVVLGWVMLMLAVAAAALRGRDV